MIYSDLVNKLETLELYEVRNNLDDFMNRYNNNEISLIDGLNVLFEKQIEHQREMSVKGIVKVAHFPFLKTLDDFDFNFQPTINKSKIMDFKTLRFIENNSNIIFYGSPGTGKTHLAAALGIEAATNKMSVYFISFEELIHQLKQAKAENRLERRLKWYSRYKLLIIDELGYQKMDQDSANLFFNLISRRYEKSSTIITTNITFSKWADIFQEPVLTNALLDRLLHHCDVVKITGKSYRIKDQISDYDQPRLKKQFETVKR